MYEMRRLGGERKEKKTVTETAMWREIKLISEISPCRKDIRIKNGLGRWKEIRILSVKKNRRLGLGLKENLY